LREREVTDMETILVRDTDMDETKPMRLIDGRLVVWHPLDSCPSARQAAPAPSAPARTEPAQSESASSEVLRACQDDPDTTQPMRILGSPDTRRIAPG
jgi:hypothetical protein